MILDAALIDEAFVLRRFAVRASEMVYVRGVLEASDGLATPFSNAGGELTVATFSSRCGELDELLADLQAELGESWLWGPEDVRSHQELSSSLK
jgi:hypothetical protein